MKGYSCVKEIVQLLQQNGVRKQNELNHCKHVIYNAIKKRGGCENLQITVNKLLPPADGTVYQNIIVLHSGKTIRYSFTYQKMGELTNA